MSDAGTAKILSAKIDDKYTFYISVSGSGCRLSVEPENRFNGTQSFDGWFPRYYSRSQDAKASLTRFLGETVIWHEVQQE